MENRQLIDVLEEKYFDLYRDLGARKESFQSLMMVIKKRKDQRPAELIALDNREQNWYMNEKMVGMMLYVDLFSKDLKSLPEKIPYLKELGITFVHLMPLLKPRQGENDGGYAVEDYLDIDPKLGSLKDFIHVLDEFRHARIDVCIDYVLNHTSDTHEWAMEAKVGNKLYQDMYIMYDSREIPDLYDQTVAAVLPEKSPGNFSYNAQLGQWIFTSFSEFQWDLNFKNPLVFEKMIDILLQLANYGVNILRLDAIAFMWKEVATDCRNLKQVHQLLHMIHLIKEFVCPSLAILGEAIVQPDEILKYFGSENEVECGLLYNANFMVNVFHSFATRDTRLMAIDNMRLKIPKSGCFMNYIRCHDDIGWGLSDDSLSELNTQMLDHKLFLNDFYSGAFKGSFSMGELYQYNPMNQDARINGTLASLLGLEKAISKADEPAIEFSLKRILLSHALIISQQGVPLIYCGDEIASINDQSYLQSSKKGSDGRWLHRSEFDWERSLRRKDKSTIEGRVFNYIKRLIKIRKSNSSFSANHVSKVIEVGNKHIYTTVKDNLLFVYNFSENNQYFKSRYFNNQTYTGLYIDLITGKEVELDEEEIHVYPYEVLWLKKVN